MGFHHADPHPGNLLRLDGPRLAYIDFGMMGNIENNIRRRACPETSANMLLARLWSRKPPFGWLDLGAGSARIDWEGLVQEPVCMRQHASACGCAVTSGSFALDCHAGA